MAKMKNYEKIIENKNKKIADLQFDKRILKKALKLAVDEIVFCPDLKGECNCKECKEDCSWYFINKAQGKYKKGK